MLPNDKKALLGVYTFETSGFLLMNVLACRMARRPNLGKILSKSCCMPRRYAVARMICNQ